MVRLRSLLPAMEICITCFDEERNFREGEAIKPLEYRKLLKWNVKFKVLKQNLKNKCREIFNSFHQKQVPEFYKEARGEN